MVEAVNATGSHWFDAGAMRFFQSRVEYVDTVDADRGQWLFISSEQFDETEPRLYTVREVDTSRSYPGTRGAVVDTVGEFQGHETFVDALATLRTYRRALVMSRARWTPPDPRDMFTD